MIECSYTGQLHCNATHVLSGTQLHTDAPTDHDGLGQSFSPTDLIATALGTCVLTIMGIAAKRQGWEIGEANAVVEKTIRPTSNGRSDAGKHRWCNEQAF